MHFYNVRQAASLLGYHPYSLYSAIYEGKLKAVKFRGNVRIPAEEVERLIESRERLNAELTVREVARILGCSAVTVLRIIHARKLKAVKAGGRYSISPTELENYVVSMPLV